MGGWLPSTSRGIPPAPPGLQRDPPVSLERSEALGYSPSLLLLTGKRHVAHGVLGPREVEGADASGAGDKSLVGGAGWGWASVQSRETEWRKRRIPREGGDGRCGWLAGRMYSKDA